MAEEDVTIASGGTASAAIGAYRLLERIGEGGMGEVWLAEQARPIHRRVALKVIKAGMDSRQVIARFEAERQALALMDHPSVATVFDGGTTEQGRPYFVMEYVKGEPITAYADRERLSIADRLELFIQVCEGVQHAHQKGIIHRDLKPSNILVPTQNDRAVPKIIDFGVAKATTTSLTDRTLYTELGSMIGTLEYMSPEQAQLSQTDIDTRSDVYSLGVILYELLCGSLPFDPQMLRAGGLEEAQRTIRTVDPPRPSTRFSSAPTNTAVIAEQRRTDGQRLRRQVRGDLDWIVMRALEKERTRRYPSVSDFASDLRRHLRDEPVMASPPSAAYRLEKFVHRHRLGVATAAGFAIVLVVFLTTMLVQAARIARERDRASKEAEAAKQVSDFLVGLFEVSDPSEARGSTLTAREILDKGASDIRQNLRSQPEVQARLQTTIGAVYTNLGAYSAADSSINEAVGTLNRSVGKEALPTLTALHALANLYWYQARYSDAEPLYRRVIDGRTRQLGADHRETLRARYDLASLYEVQKRWAEAERTYLTVLEIQRRIFGSSDPDTVSTLNNLGVLYFRQERYGDALPVQRDVLDSLTRQLGPDHPKTLMAMHSVGSDYYELRQYEQAEPLLLRSLEGKRRVLGAIHPLTLPTVVYVARLYRDTRRYDQADQLLKETYAALSDEQEPWKMSIARQLVILNETAKRPAKAAEWRARLPATQPASR